MNSSFEKTIDRQIDYKTILLKEDLWFIFKIAPRSKDCTKQDYSFFVPYSQGIVFTMKYFLAGLSVDVSKAFDCVDHEHLLIKSEGFGIRELSRSSS